MHRIETARKFAIEAHRGQKRKYSGLPYVTHPINVARTVSTVCGDPAVISAAYLHDVVEDTPISASKIARIFGARVATLVVAVTDVGEGTRAERLGANILHLADAPPDAQTIKLADIIDNVRDNPHEWYLREKRMTLEVLDSGNSWLWAVAWGLVNR